MNKNFFIENADHAWLGLSNLDTIKTSNILCKVPHNDEVVSAYEFLKIISRPDYIHMFCKEILNIQLIPLQNIVLQELWCRKFPMYIASRGQGKSYSLAVLSVLKAILVPGSKVVLTGGGFRQAKIIF